MNALGKNQLKDKLGQNTAEYMIMLTLVAIGSIGLVTIFGKTIRARMSMATAALSGDEPSYTQSRALAIKSSQAAQTRASSALTIKGIETSEFQDGVSSEALATPPK